MKCPYCEKQLLTEKQLQVVMLYCRMNQGEIAEMLGIRQQNVSKRLVAASKKFPFLLEFLKEIHRPSKIISYSETNTYGVVRKF